MSWGRTRFLGQSNCIKGKVLSLDSQPRSKSTIAGTALSGVSPECRANSKFWAPPGAVQKPKIKIKKRNQNSQFPEVSGSFALISELHPKMLRGYTWVLWQCWSERRAYGMLGITPGQPSARQSTYLLYYHSGSYNLMLMSNVNARENSKANQKINNSHI